MTLKREIIDAIIKKSTEEFFEDSKNMVFINPDLKKKNDIPDSLLGLPVVECKIVNSFMIGEKV